MAMRSVKDLEAKKHIQHICKKLSEQIQQSITEQPTKTDFF